MPWLSSGDGPGDSSENGHGKKGKEVIDLTELAGSDDGQGNVDTGITSGSDPSSWDPIDIDQNPH